MPKMNLVRPCPNCPFRNDIPAYLTKCRIDLMEQELVEDQKSFSCHATNTPHDDGFHMIETSDSEHCAGAMILLEKLERPNQWMRWMERLKDPETGKPFYDRHLLEMDSPVFDTFEEMREAQQS